MLTTDGSLPQQLGVVWSRLLEADSEGPSFISHAACARSVSSSRTFLSCACGARSIVHIGGLSTTQAAILASQTLDPIQYVPEQALRNCSGVPAVISLWRQGRDGGCDAAEGASGDRADGSLPGQARPD